MFEFSVISSAIVYIANNYFTGGSKSNDSVLMVAATREGLCLDQPIRDGNEFWGNRLAVMVDLAPSVAGCIYSFLVDTNLSRWSSAAILISPVCLYLMKS